MYRHYIGIAYVADRSVQHQDSNLSNHSKWYHSNMYTSCHYCSVLDNSWCNLQKHTLLGHDRQSQTNLGLGT